MVGSTGGGGDSGGFLWVLLAPLISLWNFIYNLLFAAPQRPQGAYNPTAAEQQAPPEAEPGTSSQTRPGRNRPKS